MRTEKMAHVKLRLTQFIIYEHIQQITKLFNVAAPLAASTLEDSAKLVHHHAFCVARYMCGGDSSGFWILNSIIIVSCIFGRLRCHASQDSGRSEAARIYTVYD